MYTLNYAFPNLAKYISGC